MAQYKLVLFDFDGVLADSAAWFIAQLPSLAEAHRFRSPDVAEIERLRGLPTRDVVKALGVSPLRLPGIAADLRKRMADEAHQIALFEGVPEAIHRRMDYAEPTKQIDFEDFSETPGAETVIGTALSLGAFKETARPRFAGAAPSTLFSAAALKRQMLMAFLQRLVGLDERLASIVWEGDETVFEDDIDREFAKLLVERSNDHAAKRPDIALFSKEGSAIIVEFKAPGVSMDDHTGDLREYAHLLAAKSGGKLNRFYCYLIGDTLNPLRLGETWTQFPTGTGWFSSGELRDPVARRQLGETYSEILFYDDVVARAKKRIRVYQDKLQLSLKT